MQPRPLRHIAQGEPIRAARPWLLAALTAVWLHYLITPAESGGGLALYLRFAVAMLTGLAALCSCINQPQLQRLPLPMCLLALWILLNNLASTTWWAVMFAGFALASMLVSVTMVAGSRKAMLQLALDMLLAAWVGLFLLQFLLYHGAGILVDIHRLLHPYSEARLLTDGDSGVLRLTGPHIEPGTYSNWVLGLVILRALVKGKWFDLAALAAVASTMLSFSLWAVAGACLYLLAAVLASLSFSRPASLLRLLVVGAVAGIVAMWLWDPLLVDALDYMSARADVDDGSGNAKLQAYLGFMNELGRVLFIGTPMDYDYCDGCLAPQDAGLAVNLVMRLGLVPTLLVLLPIARQLWRSGGAPACLASLPLLFAKFYVFDPLVWIMFGVCLLRAPVRPAFARSPRLHWKTGVRHE